MSRDRKIQPKSEHLIQIEIYIIIVLSLASPQPFHFLMAFSLFRLFVCSLVCFFYSLSIFFVFFWIVNYDCHRWIYSSIHFNRLYRPMHLYANLKPNEFLGPKIHNMSSEFFFHLCNTQRVMWNGIVAGQNFASFENCCFHTTTSRLELEIETSKSSVKLKDLNQLTHIQISWAVKVNFVIFSVITPISTYGNKVTSKSHMEVSVHFPMSLEWCSSRAHSFTNSQNSRIMLKTELDDMLNN